MYHVIGTPPAGQGPPELWVSRERFAAEMALLARRGYEAVTLETVFDAWAGRGGLPRRPVVLSFDDGYLSDGTFVARTLRARGWPGVLNLETHNLGPDGLPRHLATRMAREGWEIDSHTVDHPDLTTVDPARLRAELVDSRDRIRRELGSAPQFFCYPAGRYDATVIAAVKAAGYRGATTELPGAARSTDDPYELPRIRVNGSDTPDALLAKLG
jgi:peptidoglycan/xylan/chitin deacetylase (PgdA/CDA1 family)